MYGHKIPLDLDDFINHIVYPVELPEYALIKAPVFEKGELEPFFVPDKDRMVVSRVTIAMMIDFCSRTIPFTIIKKADIVEIYSYLKEYNRQLKAFADDSREAAEYLALSSDFHSKLHRSMVIIMKRNPEVKAIVNRDNLLQLFSG